MYVCMKQAYRNSATNIKVSIFILYSIISTSFVPNLSPLLSSLADNCNALCLIAPPARRSVSACLISYVNYRGTCKVSNLSLFVAQFRSRFGRFESSTGILFISVILVSKS